MPAGRRHLRVTGSAVALAAAALVAGCDVARELPGGAAECERCHGGGGLAAPPRSVLGFTATTERAVGAHRQHLADGAIRLAIRCDECHVVPSRVEGHFGDGPGRATVTFGDLARARGASPTWDHDLATCSGVYCHGATLAAGGAATAPVWTVVDGTQKTCGSCHGYPPINPRHPQGAVAARCNVCHPGTVLEDQVSIDVAGGLHVNGRIDFAATGGCGGCHEAPPATGAHRVHANPPSASDAVYGDLHVLEDVSPGGGAQYDFGCGHCHPLDPGHHLDGTVDVVLAPDAGAAGTLKARNAPGAAYDGGAGTCSGVYCHSSGQATPAYVTTPQWSAPPGGLGCDGCHANPPRYASGGVGAPDANSHLVLASDGWESGHFGGLPGPWHSSKHGGDSWGPGEDAAPITCQTCHADTVDPSSTAPGGFHWLDTRGDYDLGGLLGYACESCHTGTGSNPPSGSGRVLPLRHVNGKRDVVFDVRTVVPGAAWLPAAPNTPTRPYWVTNAAGVVALPDPAIPDAVAEGTTLSLHLSSARYDASTKTCSSVACHLFQTQVTWGAPNGWGACSACHGL